MFTLNALLQYLRARKDSQRYFVYTVDKGYVYCIRKYIITLRRSYPTAAFEGTLQEDGVYIPFERISTDVLTVDMV